MLTDSMVLLVIRVSYMEPGFSQRFVFLGFFFSLEFFCVGQGSTKCCNMVRVKGAGGFSIP